MKTAILATSFLFLALATAAPARACSFSWKEGYSPKEIPHRDDVVVVKGNFVFVDAATGVDVTPETEFKLDQGEALGRIERKGRKPILTKMYYSDVMLECGAYLGPPGDVCGKFWIELKRDKQGRRRLLMWKSE